MFSLGGVFAPVGSIGAVASEGRKLEAECITQRSFGDDARLTRVVKGISRCSFETAKALVAEGQADRDVRHTHQPGVCL